MSDVQQAITKALAMAKSGQTWNDLCLGFVANIYTGGASGVGNLGYPATAWNMWQHAARDKHPGDQNPPAGALVFWNVGQQGHVALSLGNGRIATTHENGGRVTIMPLAEANAQLGESVGWAAPAFPSDNYVVPSDFGSTTANYGGGTFVQNPPTQSGSGNNPLADIPIIGGSIAGTQAALDAVGNFLQNAMALTYPTTWIRIQAGIAGAVLIVVGVVLFAKEGMG